MQMITISTTGTRVKFLIYWHRAWNNLLLLVKQPETQVGSHPEGIKMQTWKSKVTQNIKELNIKERSE